MKKVIAVLCVAVVLAVTVSLPAFAASSSVLFSPKTFDLVYAGVAHIKNGELIWNDLTSSTIWETTDNGYGHLYLTSGGHSFWRTKFLPRPLAGDLLVQPYMQLDAALSFQQYSSYTSQKITGALYLTAPDGTIYEFPVKSSSYSVDRFYVSIGGTANVIVPFRFSECELELMINSVTTPTSVDVDFTMFNLTATEYISENTVKIVESIDKGFADLQEQQKQNTQDIIDNNNANTDKITGSIEDSTDEILNGWETDDDSSGSVDSITGDMENAENEALGGKSDAEIKAEVDGVLSNENIPNVDHTGVIGVAGLFDKSLVAFGQDYQSLLVLSLTLGFAAFLVGRQYRARGD